MAKIKKKKDFVDVVGEKMAELQQLISAQADKEMAVLLGVRVREDDDYIVLTSALGTAYHLGGLSHQLNAETLHIALGETREAPAMKITLPEGIPN